MYYYIYHLYMCMLVQRGRDPVDSRGPICVPLGQRQGDEEESDAGGAS